VGRLPVVLKMDFVFRGARFAAGDVFDAARVSRMKGGFVAHFDGGPTVEFSDDIAYVEGLPWASFEGF